MKLIILDRDGVINFDSPDYIKSPEEWIPIPSSLEAIAQLKKAEFTIAVVTNQSGIGRGYYDTDTLNAIHQKMQHALGHFDCQIDFIAYCPHLPDANCECRKPKPGLLLQVADHFSCSLQQVPVIGDRLSDVAAATAVNARPIMVKTSLKPEYLQVAPQIEIYPDLMAATQMLIRSQ